MRRGGVSGKKSRKPARRKLRVVEIVPYKSARRRPEALPERLYFRIHRTVESLSSSKKCDPAFFGKSHLALFFLDVCSFFVLLLMTVKMCSVAAQSQPSARRITIFG